ncbi:hypothetical protein PybrP1_006969 [[Pythium] brassicae (nom. inval.)]|nr:hypothetical protein PybrP1_006969 [[Pythium] brassicae (nom. inval.)]
MSAPALIPPFRFSSVQQGLFRGAYPTLKNFRFLQRLRLRSIVSVTPEPPTADLAAFCAAENVALHHFYAEKFTSDNVTVSPATVSQILQLLVKQEHLPLYLHCLDGANVTGIIIMVLRKLQNWTKVATVSEFCRFTRDHGIEKDESEYLAAFSEEVVVTADVPKWLWNGLRILKHPTMIIHQPDLELSVANYNDGQGGAASSSLSKWETEVEKTEAIIRQFDEASRSRALLDAGDGLDEVHPMVLEDALLDIPIPRSAEEAAEEEDTALNARELFVFAAQKAGMGDVDRARVQQVMLNMSKDSQFLRNSLRQNGRVDAKIADMQRQLTALSSARRDALQRRVDAAVAQLEAARDLSRTVVVVDMDMFYAAVEMRDDPALRDVPLAVGGMNMISTTNYIARKFGVRAAMPGFIGRELCPALVFVRPNFDKYTAVAAQIRDVFAEYDPHFSAFSLDEAMLDISEYMEEHWGQYYAPEKSRETAESESESKRDDEDAESERLDDRARVQVAAAVVNEIRHKIFLKTGLTASAGVAVNTMLAKIASDMNKPNGQFVLPFTRESVVSFIQSQPVRKIGGIGKVMEKILAAIGVITGADLFARRVELFHVFSDKTAPWLLRTSLGVKEARESTGRKSFSRERTFQNLSEPAALEQVCLKVCELLADDMEEADAGCRTLTLKLKCADFSVRSRSVSFATALKSKDDLSANALAILRKELPLTLRLLGVRASGLVSLSGAAGLPGGAKVSLKQRQLGIDRFATAVVKAEGASTGSPGSDDEADEYDSGMLSAEDDSEAAPQRRDDTGVGAVAALPIARKARRKRDGTSIAGFVTTIAKDVTPDIVAALLEASVVGDARQDAGVSKACSDDDASSLRVEAVGEDMHFDDASFQACPICGKVINVSNAIAINSHVDACINKQSRRSATSSLVARVDGGRSGKRDAVGASPGGRQRNYFPDLAAACFQPCPVCGELINASSSKLVNTHIDACVLTPLSQPTPESPPAAARATSSVADRENGGFAVAPDEKRSEDDSESRCPICGVPVDASNSVAVNKHIDACVAGQAGEERGRAGAPRSHAASTTTGSAHGAKRRRRGVSGGQQHLIHSYFSTGK